MYKKFYYAYFSLIISFISFIDINIAYINKNTSDKLKIGALLYFIYIKSVIFLFFILSIKFPKAPPKASEKLNFFNVDFSLKAK